MCRYGNDANSAVKLSSQGDLSPSSVGYMGMGVWAYVREKQVLGPESVHSQSRTLQASSVSGANGIREVGETGSTRFIPFPSEKVCLHRIGALRIDKTSTAHNILMFNALMFMR